MDARPGWDAYWMAFAKTAALRGTCKRAKVGAVIVKDNQIIASGYNGSVPGMPHCLDAGCDMLEGHCVRTVHAEMNALAQAAQHGQSVKGAALYTTVSPCWACFRVLLTAGIRTFVADVRYWHADNEERVSAVLRHHLDVRIDVLSKTVGKPDGESKWNRCAKCDQTGPYDTMTQCHRALNGAWCPETPCVATGCYFPPRKGLRHCAEHEAERLHALLPEAPTLDPKD